MATGEKRRGSRGIGLVAGLAALLAGYAVTPGVTATPAPAMTPVAEESPYRPTEGEAAAYAKQLGQRVEIGSLRGERRTAYANPDGTFTSIDHVQPVRVRSGSGWLPVDATLEAAADGTLIPKAVTYGLRLSGGGDGPLLTAERAGRSLSLSWPGDLPEPTVEGDHATYGEVLPDVDLVVTVTPESFSHVLVVKTAEAAADPRLAEIEFGLKTTGLTVRENAGGDLTVADSGSGDAVFEAPQPTMWDSPAPAAAARSAVPQNEAVPQDTTVPEVPIGVEVDKDSLTLVPDAEMLADPATTFPVYIDPVLSTSKRSAFTMVASGFPSEEYWSFDGEADEGVGECPVVTGTCKGAGVKRLFYTVPTSAYLGSTVLEAKFAVTMVHTFDGNAAPVRLYRASGGISTATNWGNQPDLPEIMQTVSPTDKAGSCSTGNQNVRFNAIEIVDDMHAGKLKSVTFGLRAVDETDHTAWKRFCGNGQLEVKYNHLPNVPSTGTMTSAPGGKCITGTPVPVISAFPVLSAYVKDADHSTAHVEQVKARIQLSWTTSTGTTQTKTYTTGVKAGDGKTPFKVTVKAGEAPLNTVITWKAAGGDDVGWSDYSAGCKFKIDRTAPPEPDIDSPDFLPLDAEDDRTADAGACVADDEDRGYAGLYSTFTFDVPGTDAVRYLYGFDEDPKNTVVPAGPGGPVTVSGWTPDDAGLHFVKVRAYDAANNPSTIAECYFGVPKRLAAGEWNFSDNPGSPTAADSRGEHPMAAGAGVTLGVPGPGCLNVSPCERDRGASFTGEADSYLATDSSALIDTQKGFTAAAWVKLTDDTKNRVAVSQDGTGVPGFTLGYDAGTKKWAFKIPVTDVRNMGAWGTVSGNAAVKNEWTHLAGVYDAYRETIELYVNGVRQTTGANVRRSAFTSYGPVQAGRSLDWGAYGNYWKGSLAEVEVYDRILSGVEVNGMVSRRPNRQAYWQLNAVSGGKSAELDGLAGRELLVEGATVRVPDPDDWEAESPMVGAGELKLDGIDDRARTTGPVVPTAGSFSVSAFVRTAAPVCSTGQSVLSQAGTANSSFRIQCTPEDTWKVIIPNTDASPSSTVIATDPDRGPTADQGGQHIAIVYDAYTRELRFYVSGELVDTQDVPVGAAFSGTGGFQIGRALVNGQFGEYFAGLVDDVRVYGGTIDDTTVQLLAQHAEQPKI
ncbi:LamG domain-containing protein [Actinoplanes sp. NPDC049596]|uniref:LamG domain-containing protein n=1 Tax=unclassified Actinoplanes TaxID=2626549 RepID=UPI00344040DE